MPLFFMLSSFSLTVMYGQTEWALPSYPSSYCLRHSSTGGPTSTADEDGKISSSNDDGDDDDKTTAFLIPPAFAWRKFYRNRVARVLPIFWLCMLIAVPFFVLNLDPIPYSLKTFLPSLFFTTFPCATLLSFLGLDSKFEVLNVPGWFVCTLVWFWLAFPWWLPGAQRLSDARLVSRIAWCYYLQLVFMFGFYVFFQQVFGGGPPAFNTAGKNPISRFPLFLMGMYAGLLALRHPPPAPPKAKAEGEGEVEVEVGKALDGSPVKAADGGMGMEGGGRAIDDEEDEGTTARMVIVGVENEEDEAAAAAAAADRKPHDGMPWPSCFLGLPLPPLACLSHLTSALAAPSTQRGWAQKASRESVAILVLSIFISAGESVFSARSSTHAGFQAQLWWQAVVPMVQLNIIVALTRDGGASLASRVLRAPLSQYLGRISMTLYLIHMPIMRYLGLLSHPEAVPVLTHCFELDTLGEQQKAACLDAMNKAHTFPIWYTAIVVPVSIVLSEILYRMVEVPARRFLRAK
jgi:peptidoglycan/LPS O-acetylase OafA/YrhL